MTTARFTRLKGGEWSVRVTGLTSIEDYQRGEVKEFQVTRKWTVWTAD